MAALSIYNKIWADPLHASVASPRPAIFMGFGVKPCKAPQGQPGLRRRILRSIGNYIFTMNIKEFLSCTAVQAHLADLACFAVTLSPCWTHLSFSPLWGFKRMAWAARTFLPLPLPQRWLQCCRCPAASLAGQYCLGFLVFCIYMCFSAGITISSVQTSWA